jgi:hypothetical protein
MTDHLRLVWLAQSIVRPVLTRHIVVRATHPTTDIYSTMYAYVRWDIMTPECPFVLLVIILAYRALTAAPV